MSLGSGYINILNDTRDSLASSALARTQQEDLRVKTRGDRLKHSENVQTSKGRVAATKATDKLTALTQTMQTEQKEALREKGAHVQDALEQQELDALARDGAKAYELLHKASRSEADWEAVRGYLEAAGESKEEIDKRFGEEWNQGKLTGYAAHAAEDAEHKKAMAQLNRTIEGDLDVANLNNATSIKVALINAQASVEASIASARRAGKVTSATDLRGQFTFDNTGKMLTGIAVNAGLIKPKDVKANDGKGTPEYNALINEANARYQEQINDEIMRFQREEQVWIANGRVGEAPTLKSSNRLMADALRVITEVQNTHEKNFGGPWIFGSDTEGSGQLVSQYELDSADARRVMAKLKVRYPGLSEYAYIAMLDNTKHLYPNLFLSSEQEGQ